MTLLGSGTDASETPAVWADAARPTPNLRDGCAADAHAIHQLIEANRAAGRLLPRTVSDLERNAPRFVVLAHGDALAGCAELAPLSRAVAEVRSLVVDERWRRQGLASRLVDALRDRAREAGFSVLCAFAHDPHHFVRLGFSMVPHVWFPEKVTLDCTSCERFGRCGQYALALPLSAAGLLPSLSRLREPLPAGPTIARHGSSLPPVRLRVIA
jgi:amino-acid N-acetyltransferase